MNLLLISLMFLPQEDAAKAKEILGAVAATMKEAPALSFECTVTWQGMGDPQKVKVQLKRPNLARLETTSREDGYLYILDGKTFCVYTTSINQYMKMDQSSGMEGTLGSGPLPMLYIDPTLDLLKSAKDITVKEEKIREQKFDVLHWSDGVGESWLWVAGNKA